MLYKHKFFDKDIRDVKCRFGKVVEENLVELQFEADIVDDDEGAILLNRNDVVALAKHFKII